MSITQALSNATSGLSAASRRASVTANNISNALTPGYSRRSVALGERVVDGRGAGVGVNGIIRAAVPALTADRRAASAELGVAGALDQTQGRLAQLVGGVNDPGAIFSRFASLESALASFADTPESAPAQAGVISAASGLASGLATLNDQATALRRNADGDIASGVASINQALDDIVDLNQSIEIAFANGRETAAFEDRRAQLIDQVSEEIAVSVTPAQNGKVDLITPQGVFLIAGDAQALSFTPASSVSLDAPLSGLSIGGVDITPGASQGLSGGRLAGLFEVRDQILPEFGAQIDAVAQDLVARFENIGAPAGAPGGLALFVDSAGAGAPVAGLAGRLEINAAVDPAQGGETFRLRDGFAATVPGPAGNNTNAVLLLDAFRAPASAPGVQGLPVSVGAADLAAGFSSLRTSGALASENASLTAAARFDTLFEAELNETGVDTDQELAELIEIEQAFAANARVIEVADRLIQRLIDL